MKSFWALFSTSLVVGFSGALMPGPLLTMVITETAQRGFWQGPLLVVGHAIAELTIVGALAAGLSRLLQKTAITGLIGLLGGGFLLWMGFDIVRGAWLGTVALDLATGPGGGSALGAIPTGVLVSVSNPYWVVWWATVGAGYVALALQQGVIGLGSFYTGHILSDAIWYIVVAFVVATGRSLLSDGLYRGVLGVCGAFLLVLGAYFVYSGVRFLGGQAKVEE